jgi:hypothetical protein
MKRSMGLHGQALSFTTGTAGRRGGAKDQCFS